MPTQILNIILAFLEGFALIVSPCILPILPIVLSGGMEGGKKRPLGIIIGFVIVFALFTIFSRVLVQYLNFDLDKVRYVSYGLIILFGIVLISDTLSEKFSNMTQPVANIGTNFKEEKNNTGFFSGLLLGGLISLIWVPCAGPILATAIVQAAVQKTTWQSFLIFLSFALGSIIPMLLIALLGKKLIMNLQFIKKHTRLIRKFFGTIIIVGTIVAAIIGPSMAYAADETSPQLMDGLNNPYAAPPLKDITAWINSSPLTIESLRGKVVLIDFWAYSCINCVRTLPYLNQWYDKYHKSGLIIIGVHSPEFEFEKKYENIKRAVTNYKIQYPVAIDNDYGTWLSYQNKYWPAHFLINRNGQVVYEHFGEGKYAETEHNIQVLLGMKPTTNVDALEIGFATGDQTPEIYLGYKRAEYFLADKELAPGQTTEYAYASKLPLNAWSLNGMWTSDAENIVAEKENSAIKLHFLAKKVFAVMGSENDKTVEIKVLLNGKPASEYKNKEIVNGDLKIAHHGVYQLLEFQKPTEGTLELIAQTPGVKIYTFTFG